MPVSSMDSYNSLTCLGHYHYVSLKRMLQVGNLGLGSEQEEETLKLCLLILSQASQLGLGKFT